MEVLYANILAFLTRFFSFFSSFFKKSHRLIRSLLEITKYLLLVLVFTIVDAKTGMFASLICMFIELLKYLYKDKNIFFKTLITIFMIFVIYYFKLYINIVDLTLFIIIFFKMWLSKLFNSFFLTIFSFIKYFLIMWYAYTYKVYMIDFYLAIDFGFNLGMLMIKKINNFANKRIN